jgi:hypothetical protein
MDRRLDEAFERGVSQPAIGRDAAKVDLGGEDWRHGNRAPATIDERHSSILDDQLI